MCQIADDAEQHAGIGPGPVERGQAAGGFFGSCLGFDAFDRSADPDGLLSSVEIAVTVPFGPARSTASQRRLLDDFKRHSLKL